MKTLLLESINIYFLLHRLSPIANPLNQQLRCLIFKGVKEHDLSLKLLTPLLNKPVYIIEYLPPSSRKGLGVGQSSTDSTCG